MTLEVIHVTNLSQYNACPYLFSQPQKPLHPEITYRWDILNVAVTSSGLLSPFIKWFAKNMRFDMKEVHIMKEIYEWARKKMWELRAKHEQVYQEAKMLYKYNDDTYVIWTPDIFYYDEERKLRCIRDWKFSVHSWYWNPDVVKYDMQPVIYPLMVMEYMDVKEAEFAFRCYDKKSGKLWEFVYHITYDEAKKRTDKVIEEYLASKDFGDYECRPCNKCNGMCDLRKQNKCPLYKLEKKVEEKVDDFLDF